MDKNELFEKYEITPSEKEKAELAFKLAENYSSRVWEVEGFFRDMLPLFIENPERLLSIK